MERPDGTDRTCFGRWWGGPLLASYKYFKTPDRISKFLAGLPCGAVSHALCWVWSSRPSLRRYRYRVVQASSGLPRRIDIRPAFDKYARYRLICQIKGDPGTNNTKSMFMRH